MKDETAVRAVRNGEPANPQEIYDASGVVSTGEAAAASGISEGAIRRAIRNGELIATRNGRSFQIRQADLDDFLARRGVARRPKPHLRLVEPLVPDETPDLEPVPVPLFIGEPFARPALPASLTRFIGRSRELAALERVLLDDDVRLVTLTGPGGVGKTRLALQVAREIEPSFPDGAVFVSLASVQQPELIASTMIQALGLTESDHLPPQTRLVAAIRDRTMLIVLDNLEHLLHASQSAASLVADLLTSCSGLTLLATSRTLLHLSGEHAFTVPPLDFVARRSRQTESRSSSPALLRQLEAVQLFEDRARVARPDFALTAENTPVVAAICERVDGLPLAIELAAARSAVLTPSAMLSRLQQRLPLLTAGPHDQPARLQTMRNAIAWSYELLDAAAQMHLRRLAIFAGGFSVSAAEAVAAFASIEPQRDSEKVATMGAQSSVLDSLTNLLASSLVWRDEHADKEPRFAMLETVREYALDQLQGAGEEDAARAAHAGFFLEMMQKAEPLLWASTNMELLDRIEIEHDNLRAALTWSIDADPQTALRLVDGLGAFWSKRSHWSEGREWLERALAADRGGSSVARATALGRQGAIAGDQGDFEEARHYLESSLAVANQIGAEQVAARALRGLGILASNQSNFEQARELFEHALTRFRSLGDQPGIARSLNDLGLVAERQGDHERAISYQEEALPIARAVGDEWQICIILGNLGGAYYDQGDFPRGEALSLEALELARRLGDTFGVAVNVYNVATFVLQRGDPIGAIAHYRECLTLLVALSERHLAARALARLGVALHLTGSSREAARLMGAAAALHEALGDSLSAEEEVNLTIRFQEVRDALGAPDFAALWETGRSLPFEPAMAEAIALADEALAAHYAGPAQALAGLTRREVDVLRLLADGQGDKEIGSSLYISARTASNHVSAIIAKLNVESRTAAVALAIRAGIV